jgi:hypothetical protein
MPCVECNRKRDSKALDQGVFLCWYCKVARSLSAAEVIVKQLDGMQEIPKEIAEVHSVLKRELAGTFHRGYSLQQLQKPIKRLALCEKES